MPISHVEMAGRLLGADPHFAAADFKTVSADGEVGETGSLLYASRDRWIVDTDYGGRTIHLPHETRHEDTDGTRLTVPGPSSPSFISPIALLLPRYRAIHGRPGDDWIIDDREPIRTDVETGLLRVGFRRMEDSRFTGTALVHHTEYCITSFTSPVAVSELTDLRFDLTEPEAQLARSLLGAT